MAAARFRVIMALDPKKWATVSRGFGLTGPHSLGTFWGDHAAQPNRGPNPPLLYDHNI